tara:strand:- start:189 stop:593 length:405 start_codon:yes stop_codon:yes gene_type:complete
MLFYSFFLYFIIFVKLIFVISLLAQLTENLNEPIFDEEFYELNHENKEKIENLYFFLMAVLLIYIFKDRTRKSYSFNRIELELLFVFGFVLSFKLFVNWLKGFMDKHDEDDDHEDEDNTLNIVDNVADASVEII